MMASVDPTTTTSRETGSGKLLARSRLGDLFDILIAIAASPLVLCQTVIFPCFPRDRLLALLALALAAVLGVWAVSASGTVATALPIAFKWDLVPDFLYAAAMFLSPALRWAVGLSVFAGTSAVCLRAIARPAP
jgi:hypothetical protein